MPFNKIRLEADKFVRSAEEKAGNFLDALSNLGSARSEGKSEVSARSEASAQSVVDLNDNAASEFAFLDNGDTDSLDKASQRSQTSQKSQASKKSQASEKPPSISPSLETLSHYEDCGVESPQATLPVHPGHVWQYGIAVIPEEPEEPEEEQTEQEYDKVEDDMTDDEPQMIIDPILEQYKEVLRRLDRQDDWLRQVMDRMSMPLTAEVQLQSVPVHKVVTTQSADPSVISEKLSDRSAGKNSGGVSRNSRGSRRSSRHSQGSFTPPVPKLFTTFSQYNLNLQENAEGAHAEMTRRRFASQRQETSLRSSPLRESCAAICRRIVDSSLFDVFFALIVFTNSIFIGVEVEVALQNQDGTRPLAMVVIQYVYTSLFTLELLLRGCVGGRKYFCGEEWMWTWLDVFIVLTSLWEVGVDIYYLFQDKEEQEGMLGITGLKAFRIVRITRLFKAVRLMRIFRFVRALRTLITSILHTLKSLFWALVLLVLIVYVFSVLFTQVLNDELAHAPEWSPYQREQAIHYFGDLNRTMLSLFMSIAGGVSWEAVLLPLLNVSIVWAFAFLFYISFTYFAVLNVVTGVFCHSAIESAQHDHAAAVQSILEDKEAHVEKVRELFSKFGAETEGGITFAMLQDRLNDAPVREYLETLGLDISDAWSFFKLLDLDGGGSVEIEEFLMGCLRLRGNARAIDVSKIIHDQTWLIKNHGKFQTYVEEQMGMVLEEIHQLRRTVKRTTSSFTNSFSNSPALSLAQLQLTPQQP